MANKDFEVIFQHAGKIYQNLTVPQLVEEALRRDEGSLTCAGALRVTTGKYTGRSPNDKFIVDTPAVHEEIAWTSNKPISEEAFDHLYGRMLAYAQGRELYLFDGVAGADEQHHLKVRFINEFAWQNLFVHQLFIRPAKVQEPEFQVLCLPGFQADPDRDGTHSEAFILLHLTRKMVLIGGTHYAGEMKKSVFSIINYLLPKQGILSMHCSANVSKDGNSALFFGLSGTGKTTLSADPQRYLIGDDEHGWNDTGIFNVEGGCYAKCIRLSQENEPQIWDAIRFGTVLENVAMDPEQRTLDYDDGSLTENSRAAYPLDYIPGAVTPSIADHPQAIIFLTADAFGVLPPVAKLSRDQAIYHFLSGYTSKLAGTERGVTEPEATFSACFGAPFLPLSPFVYAKLLGEKIDKHGTQVYLINTGWSGGAYGTGERISIPHTRAMVTAAITGELAKAEYVPDPIFQIHVPKACPGVPSEILTPRNLWADKQDYDKKAKELASLFIKNFDSYQGDMQVEIAAAGPKVD